MKYFFLSFLVTLITCLPRFIALKLAYFFGSIAHSLSHKKRAIIQGNLRSLEHYSQQELSTLSKKIFQNFFICFADFCRFTRLDMQGLLRILTDNKIAIIKEAYALNKGLIALTAHLGHWELGAIILALHGLKTHVIYHPYDDEQIAHFFNRIRHPGMLWMKAEGGLRESLKILKNNEVLTTAVDINYLKGGILVPFLNTKKTFPLGPAILSLHTGAPIVCAYTLLNQDKKTYKTIVDPPIMPNPRAQKNEELERITTCIAQNIEKNIRQYPDQWFIFEDFKD